MLNTEEAQKQLSAARKPKVWLEARQAQIEKLEVPVRAAGRLLLGMTEEGKPVKEDRAYRMRQRGNRRLLRLSDAQLKSLGAALLPQMPEAFAGAWELIARLPVNTEMDRRPFHSADPRLVHQRRAEWIGELLGHMEGYDQDVTWLAAWAGHINPYSYGTSAIGLLLAGAIDAGRAEVKRILMESASGTHEIGVMGRHVTTALLCSADEEGWEFCEKLLLAAQRQEGLRQAILETVDCAHPQAFRRFAELILDQRMCRFSSVIRAADVWFGFGLDSVAQKYVEHAIERMLAMLECPGEQAVALQGSDADEAYLALWCTAFEEVREALAPARALLKHKKAEVRAAAVRILSQLGLPEMQAALLPALEDEDPRIVAAALSPIAAQLSYGRYGYGAEEEEDEASPPVQADVFPAMEKLYQRTPAKMKPTKELALPWPTQKYTRGTVLSVMLNALGERSPSAMLGYVDDMEVNDRTQLVMMLRKEKSWSPEIRATMLKLVGDSSPGVREAVVGALAKCKITAEEAQELLPLLSRKAADLRRGVLQLLLGLSDTQAMACATVLLEGDAPQRLAGLDLLRSLHEAKRASEQVAEAARGYQVAHPKLSRDEEVCLQAIGGGEQAGSVATLEDALGLMEASQRTPRSEVHAKAVQLSSPAALKLLKELDDLIHEHRKEAFTYKDYNQKEQSILLGEAEWQFPWPADGDEDTPKRSTEQDLPMAGVWLKWWDSRDARDASDAEGPEIVRAMWALGMDDPYGIRAKKYAKTLQQRVGLCEPPKLRYGRIVSSLLQWFVLLRNVQCPKAIMLDAFETIAAAATPEELRDADYAETWRSLAGGMTLILRSEPNPGGKDRSFADTLNDEQFAQYYRIERYVNDPGPKNVRQRIDLQVLARAFRLGLANEHDVYEALLGPRTADKYSTEGFDDLGTASARKPPAYITATPKLAELVQRARQRVLEIELNRGEQETCISKAALDLNYSGSADLLVRVLQAMGRDPAFKRNIHSWTQNTSKACVYSHLVRISWPGAADTPESTAAMLKAAGIDEDVLIAVAFFAPQWAPHMEKALGWEAFEDAVWWIHAHTKDNGWSVAPEIREAWNAQIRQRTPLTLEELLEGATDVAWFRRIYEKLGKKRWERLDEYAKYASSGSGHARARLFASAMLGDVTRKELTDAITKKRKQDAVRALGLLPLAAGEKRKKDLLERYKILQEFIRTSRQFGSIRQASEKRAAAIGQQNLARSAGYPDPIRLQWAMEAESCADLAKGPVIVKAGEVSVSLAIGEDGLPEVTCTKAGKELKTIPPTVKKLEAVQELLERKTELRRSASRMRLSLELAMCRGDRFSGTELAELMGNPVLRPMLERLVFVGEGDAPVLGYPAMRGEGGAALRDAAGQVKAVAAEQMLRLAHPHDLLKTGAWSAWQHECFAAERVQPFKQVFRELYVLTAAERTEANQSRRYAGQQVNPRQAMAVLGQRGWVATPEEGCFRPFFDEGIIAWIDFLEAFFTPAEVEGLTVETIRFARRGEYKPMPLDEVPPRVFSEVMRDLDLIVSVAHRGQVDPEASASTVEMRAALLRETCELLQRGNVVIRPPHVVIQGQIAEYSLHLGSGNVHKLPGGMLFIVPVHSQHRGRLFLPFADDDPKTAEILSKAILLSRDQEIQDPALLEQIRALG